MLKCYNTLQKGSVFLKTVNLSDELHKQIKILSAETGKPIKELLALGIEVLKKESGQEKRNEELNRKV
jgi:hypothetical protein